MAEQLLFTWADHGLEGRGMAQIVAATERLYLRLPNVLRKARELCTEFAYPAIWPDAAAAPVSFGWRDFEGLRFAFRRVHRGTDAFGRPGVFAAHVLVDRPERLAADALLARADSPGWWSGHSTPDGDGWLPSVPLDAFEAIGADAVAGDVSDDVTAAVMTAVLAHRGRPVLLAMEAATFTTALLRMSAALPGALDDLSVSTYEPAATRRHYGLAAVQPPDADDLAIPVGTLLADENVAGARRIARTALAGDSRQRSFLDLAWKSVTGMVPPGRAEFLEAARAYLELQAGRTTSAADLLPALRSTGTAADLLDLHAARMLLARALGAGDARVASRLREVGGRLEPETWRSLGSLTARQATHPSGLNVAWRLLSAMSSDGLEAFVEESVAVAAQDADRVQQWPIQLIVAACELLPVRENRALSAAVVQAGARRLLQLAAIPTMPAGAWARMLHRAMQGGDVEDAAAANAVAASDALARAVGEVVPDAYLARLLDALAPTVAVTMLARWVGPGRGDRWVEFAGRLAQRFDDREAWRAAAAVDGLLRTEAPARWPSLRDRVLRRRINHELAEPRACPAPLLQVCRSDTTADGRAWREYLQSLGEPAAAESWGYRAALIDSCIGALPTQHQQLATRYAVQCAASRTPRTEDLAAVVWALKHRLGDDLGQVAELMLLGGLRATIAHGDARTGQLALACVAVYLVQPAEVRCSRITGALSREAAQALAVRLYAAVDRRDPNFESWWQEWSAKWPRADRWLRGLRVR